MAKQNKKKPQYFVPDDFVDLLLKDLRMNNIDPKTLEELRKEITFTLVERVNSVVVSSLGEDELFLLQKTLEDHPELDEIDCLSIIAPNIEGLNERIVKTVDDLYLELLEKVKTIDKQINRTH